MKGDDAMFIYLGEIDCVEDLIDLVGEDEARKVYRGKLNYFKDLSNNTTIAVSDFAAESIFESGEVV